AHRNADRSHHRTARRTTRPATSRSIWRLRRQQSAAARYSMQRDQRFAGASERLLKPFAIASLATSGCLVPINRLAPLVVMSCIPISPEILKALYLPKPRSPRPPYSASGLYFLTVTECR